MPRPQATFSLLAVVTLLLLILPMPASSNPCLCEGNFNDAFGDGALPSFWVLETGCGIPSETAGQLVLAKPATCTGGLGIHMHSGQALICGDFDITVDFSLPMFPVPGSGDTFGGLQLLKTNLAPFATVERYNRQLGACNPGQQSYKAWTTTSSNCDPAVKWASTNHASGRLRITRTGTAVGIFYWNNGWVQLKSDNLTTEAVVIHLFAFTTAANTALEMRFDNLIVQSSVGDLVAPVISSPPDQTVQCSSQVSEGSPSHAVASDNCGVPNVTLSETHNGGVGSATNPIVIVRTYTATDAAGNSASAVQTITVIDDILPVISQPANVARSTGPSATACTVFIADSELGTATATDNCDAVSLSRSGIPPGNLFPPGETILTHTALDAVGNLASATQRVLVSDNTPPTIVAPASITQPSATLPVPSAAVALGTPTVGDNCAVASVTNDAPASYPAGTTIVTWTVTDVHANTSSATQSVTILPAATVDVVSALHVVGSGSVPGSSKTPLLLDLKVFDRAAVGSANPHDYANIWNSSTAPVLPLGVVIAGPTQVTIGNGLANQYSVSVPAGGSYLVIGQASVGSATVYVGSPTDFLEASSTTKRFLQVIQQANGKTVPAKTTPVPGSLLLVTEPEYIEFTSAEELYPIVYESVEGDWRVTVHADPPEGFVSQPGALTAQLETDDLRAVQFTIVDVGSDWTVTRVSHKLHHRGRERTVVTEARMINRQRGRPAKAEPGTQPAASRPTTYALRQNHPDPFNPTTTIEFDLPEAAVVTLHVYDVTGRRVRTVLERREYAPGRHQAHFDGSGLPTGVYLYRLQAGPFHDTRRMVLLK